MFLIDSSTYNEEDNKDPSYGQAFTYAEILYNIALCHLLLNRKVEALKLLNEVATLHINIEESCLLLIKVLKETDSDHQ